jgi:hypothetical protein
MSLSARTRFEVLKRDGFACQYCGGRAPDVVLHIDHIVARANGGEDDVGNLITSCATCNLGKGIQYVVSQVPCCFCESKTAGLFFELPTDDPLTSRETNLRLYFVCKRCVSRAVTLDCIARSIDLGRWAIRHDIFITESEI